MNGGHCYKYGEVGHKIAECPQKEDKCLSPECKKLKRMVGKVFALSGEGADQVDNLIR
ncbi:hypothetical protein A2U01_0060478, partial [Trifolium medium]|nr:hypothetical protein [Trifolium medium]